MTEEEGGLFEIATRAGAAVKQMSGSPASDAEQIVVAVTSEIAKVALRGVARLRFRPHTTVTKEWAAEKIEECRDWSRYYADYLASLGQGAA
ncbi:hypothetical protein AB5I41_14100 [Sphingomonas sp. MMS24-JH45]